MKVGDILTKENFTEGAIFCNKNGYVINQETWQIEEKPEPSQEEKDKKEIERLKQELNATDYKIIKCSECSLAGEPLPYDIAELHETRQAIRDRINELGG